MREDGEQPPSTTYTEHHAAYRSSADASIGSLDFMEAYIVQLTMTRSLGSRLAKRHPPSIMCQRHTRHRPAQRRSGHMVVHRDVLGFQTNMGLPDRHNLLGFQCRFPFQVLLKPLTSPRVEDSWAIRSPALMLSECIAGNILSSRKETDELDVPKEYFCSYNPSGPLFYIYRCDTGRRMSAEV